MVIFEEEPDVSRIEHVASTGTDGDADGRETIFPTLVGAEEHDEEMIDRSRATEAASPSAIAAAAGAASIEDASNNNNVSCGGSYDDGYGPAAQAAYAGVVAAADCSRAAKS